MSGYLDGEGAESGLLTTNGRTAYRTGDLVVAEGGRIYFTGRKGGFVKTRGYRVSPQEVENAFLASAKIKECAAVAVPDPVAENLLVLCYVTHDGGALEAADLEKHAESRLAPYAIPRRFVRCERIPKSSAGKIDQTALRKSLFEIGRIGS
jgi:acyl-CoA synthetase (AMP-forming)/AMP-acid ligase II